MPEWDWQLIAVGLIVAVAVTIIARRLLRLLGGRSSGCGQCGGSTSSPTSGDKPIVSLDEHRG